MSQLLIVSSITILRLESIKKLSNFDITKTAIPKQTKEILLNEVI